METIEIFSAFTCGFLLACAIFRTRRPAETPDEVRAAAMKRFYSVAARKVHGRFAFFTDMTTNDTKWRLHEAEMALKAAKEIEQELLKEKMHREQLDERLHRAQQEREQAD